ncbi:hypothetical protein D3C86_1721760 [compost metagenome]
MESRRKYPTDKVTWKKTTNFCAVLEEEALASRFAKKVLRKKGINDFKALHDGIKSYYNAGHKHCQYDLSLKLADMVYVCERIIR